MSALHASLQGTIMRGLLAVVTMGKRRVTGQLRMRAQEVGAKVEIFHPYGMSSNPLPGGDVLIFAIGGTRDHLIALLDDSALRIADLAAGEFGFRHANGTQIVFRGDRLEITATVPVDITSPTSVAMDAPSVSSTGNLAAGTGASGSFTTPTGQVVTVQDGIITNIF